VPQLITDCLLNLIEREKLKSTANIAAVSVGASLLLGFLYAASASVRVACAMRLPGGGGGVVVGLTVLLSSCAPNRLPRSVRRSC
jgi:hypothetical protein